MKLARVLFYTLIFSFPINWGYHFITNGSYLHGVLVDYSIPTIRFTDVLILMFIFSVFKKTFRSIKVFHFRKEFYLLVLFIILSFIGAFNSLSVTSFLIFYLKLIEMLLFFIAVSLIKAELDFSLVAKILILSAFLVSILGLFQFIFQKSVFGYYFYGEPLLAINIPQVAKAVFFGRQKMLPYGLFPHPNILGGYLSIVFIWMMYFFTKIKKNVVPVLVSVGGFIIFILILTRSISALLSLILGGTLFYFLKRYIKVDVIRWLSPKREVNADFILGIPVITVLAGGLICLLPKLGVNAISVSRRVDLLLSAKDMFLNSPIFGVGLNNFIINLLNFMKSSDPVYFLQPVHNLFVLIAVEGGIFAILIFLIFYSLILKNLFIKIKVHMKIIDIVIFVNLIQILIISMLDHYFWTIQQGQMLFWMTLGLASVANNLYKDSTGKRSD